MKPLLVTRLVPETHVIVLKHNRLPKRVRLILATRLYPARLSLPTGEGMVGEAGTQVETWRATSLLVHAEVISAQPRPHRRNVKRRGPSRREKGQACLSAASSWPLAGEVPGAVPPVQPAAFLLGIFFFRLYERRSTLSCHAERTYACPLGDSSLRSE